MPIQVTGDVVETTPTFDRVFIVKLTMEQARRRNTAAPLRCIWQVDYQVFGVDADGLRHFSDKIRTERIVDEGQGLADIEAFIAANLATDARIDTAVVV